MTLKLRGTSHAKSLLKLFSAFYLPFIIRKASVNSSQKVEPLFRDVLNSKGTTVWGNHLLQLIAKRVAMLSPPDNNVTNKILSSKGHQQQRL